MALPIPGCVACTAVVAVFAMVKASQGQTCSLEKMENVTLDILAAFSKGLRGTDPVYRLSGEACVRACCSETIAGDKSCNYVVFYPKKKSHSPNCYRFYYPDKETCPMKQAFGLVTYRMIKDQETPKPPPPPLNKLSHPTTNGRLVFDLGHPPSGQDPLQKFLAPQTEKIFSPTKQPLGEVGLPSQQPSPERTKKLGSSLVHDNSILRQAATTDPQASGTPTAPPPVLASHPPTQPSNAGRAPPQPAALFKSGLHLTTSSLPAPGRGFHLRNRQLDSAGSASEKEASPLGDQAILLAVLCFGVLFFLLVAVMIGRKVIGSLQQGRHAQRDYLISDMYTKM